MGIDVKLVHGGGWFTRQTIGRPKARLFTFLSIIWLCVSIPASMPFWLGLPGPFFAVHWLCTLLLLPHPVFVVLAIIFSLSERPRTITEAVPNPDRDIRNLY